MRRAQGLEGDGPAAQGEPAFDPARDEGRVEYHSAAGPRLTRFRLSTRRLEPMSYHVWIILAYLFVLLGFNFWRSFKVKSQEDFMVAGRSLTMPVLVFTLVCTWIGSGTFIAGAEFAYHAGFSALWMAAGAWVGIIIIYFLAARVRTFGQYTIGDILEVRYGKFARLVRRLRPDRQLHGHRQLPVPRRRTDPQHHHPRRRQPFGADAVDWRAARGGQPPRVPVRQRSAWPTARRSRRSTCARTTAAGSTASTTSRARRSRSPPRRYRAVEPGGLVYSLRRAWRRDHSARRARRWPTRNSRGRSRVPTARSSPPSSSSCSRPWRA